MDEDSLPPERKQRSKDLLEALENFKIPLDRIHFFRVVFWNILTLFRFYNSKVPL
jgi:hypothetical protein